MNILLICSSTVTFRGHLHAFAILDVDEFTPWVNTKLNNK